jgi:hypothetical protein
MLPFGPFIRVRYLFFFIWIDGAPSCRDSSVEIPICQGSISPHDKRLAGGGYGVKAGAGACILRGPRLARAPQDEAYRGEQIKRPLRRLHVRQEAAHFALQVLGFDRERVGQRLDVGRGGAGAGRGAGDAAHGVGAVGGSRKALLGSLLALVFGLRDQLNVKRVKNLHDGAEFRSAAFAQRAIKILAIEASLLGDSFHAFDPSNGAQCLCNEAVVASLECLAQIGGDGFRRVEVFSRIEISCFSHLANSLVC